MNRRLYALHRWISLVAVFQLLAWSLSGFFFAVVPEPMLMTAPVRGAHDVALGETIGTLSSSELAARARQSGVGEIRSIELRGTTRGPVAILTGSSRRIRLDASSGDERAVDRDEAIATARRDQPLGPRAVEATRIIADAPIEYRNKPLPAWRVLLDDGNATVVYVDATTAQVTARRNGTWRIYDFLWSLHIMDYGDRENFRHPLLAVAAALTILTALTGATLWGVRFARRAKRSRPKVS